ncbi:Acetylcholine receptor subunit beta-type acr-3 [Toxocara canis]|uniref:Acetylcholine receptor subunit beta-type acr-3 n=1 Tax=Toxocara canis TaxID=6265 RepID=A0A0B2UNW8_TOXCA|nr:Acetylcholine receptor subunit beta-type acr-3 [Toxocara canis]
MASAFASEDEEHLISDLFRGYNHLVRPVRNVSSRPVEIAFSLAMVLLINVDEKNQIMQTNVWPTMRWVDYQMRWDPRDYAQIRTIRVPPDKVWLPDIVLFNNADGNYEVSFYSNVVVEHTGEMLWVPPAIYKSSCTIDVEFFPFDEQTCAMIFGSWTFNKDEVTINYLTGKRQVELNDYSPSGIWDVMDVPGELIQSKSKIAYQIRIRRKTLFYTVILIIPTVLMAFLSMMVFYLPAEASEKITLAISILLALVVFLLLVSKILPPTSSTIPLMAKYLLMTFVMNIITILVTVVIINIYFRGPTTHKMPDWVKRIFLKQLPMLLIMKRPDMVETFRRHQIERARRRRKRYSTGDPTVCQPTTSHKYQPGEFVEMSRPRVHHPYCSLRGVAAEEGASLLDARNGETMEQKKNVNEEMRGDAEKEDKEEKHTMSSGSHSVQLTEGALRTIDAVEYITNHLRRGNNFKRIREEWKYVAMVIDRLLLYVFFAVTAGGTMGILFSAPNIFEYVNQTAVIEMLQKSAEADVL